MKKTPLPPNVRARWFEVWYANPMDNDRDRRVDGRRRSEATAQALADDLIRRKMTAKAWLVEINRLVRSPA